MIVGTGDRHQGAATLFENFVDSREREHMARFFGNLDGVCGLR